MYARGMSVREIQGHLQEIYGVKVGRDLISRVTDAVMDDVRDWCKRPLEDIYPIVFLDCMVLKIREGGSVQRRALYLALGVTLDGDRDVLGRILAQQLRGKGNKGDEHQEENVQPKEHAAGAADVEELVVMPDPEHAEDHEAQCVGE
jgi:transposase-like protein